MGTKILLCPPAYFHIDYEINPWMHIENNVTGQTVFDQYKMLKDTYTKLNIPFQELTPTKGLPDQVYTTDVGYPEGNIFIKANYKYPQRQKESGIAAAFFKSNGYEIKTIPEDIFFEGEGDFLKVEDKYFFGWGKRSMKEAKRYIEEILKKDIIDIELTDPYFYHLDTCLGLISTDIAIINEKAHTSEGLEKIHNQFKTVIKASTEDNNKLACNLVVVDKNVIINDISDELKNEIESYGYTVHRVNTSEYIKGGGSVKCLSLQIF
jgi:N-dimethylarginine dimethylaminohydrolase